MKESSIPFSKVTPKWASECFSLPRKGVTLFLEKLCELSGAKYAHIRILSRYGKFYKMVESVGPYKNIGWKRRFRLLDDKNTKSLSYKFIDYRETNDCQLLEQKYNNEQAYSEYLKSLTHGLWLPLKCGDIELGYVMLSWVNGKPDSHIASCLKQHMESISLFIPLLFSACRSVITDSNFTDLWTESGIILSSPSEALCFDRIAEACIKLWGLEATVYVGKVDPNNSHIEVVSVVGRHAIEAKKDVSKQKIPMGKGLFSYALKSTRPIISFSIPDDDRFEYHSMRDNEKGCGSAIAARLCQEPNKAPIAVISVEHELENYFDYDDIRYINGIARVGFETIIARMKTSEQISREIDTLFTQMSHDVVEPLQALVANADVLKYEASHAADKKNIDKSLKTLLEKISSRAANFLETSIQLNAEMWKHLENGIDGASTKRTEGRVRIYSLLNSLVDTWDERAASQGIELKSFFDAFRGVEVACDETELKSALGHLLGNAIKYSFWGRRQYQEGSSRFGRFVSIVGRIGLGMAIIEFQNYGVGIRKSEFTAVKQKFYRGELALKEGRAGTGRGLWSASTFFESIGGRVEVFSEPKGSDPTLIDGPYYTTVQAIMPYINPEEV